MIKRNSKFLHHYDSNIINYNMIMFTVMVSTGSLFLDVKFL